MEAAAAFLAVRSRSVDETRRRLLHLGYQANLVEAAVEKLLSLRYLDDEGFARAWVESRDRTRPRGEQALRRELTLKGISRDTIVGVLGERAEGYAADAAGRVAAGELDISSPDRVAAERLIARRRQALMREPDERKRRQRAYALLARYGFDPQICHDVATSLSRAAEDDSVED